MTSLRTIAQEMGLRAVVSARAMARTTETAVPMSLKKVAASHYIQSKYKQVGGHLGPLGSVLTTVTEQATLYRRAYRGGEIQFTATQGATGVVRHETTIRYIGFRCIKRAKDRFGAPSNEPYIVVGIYPPSVREQVTTMKVPASGGYYSGIDGGDFRTEPVDLWSRRSPEDMVIACLIMEHDDGDPQKIQDAIQAALKKAADAGEAAAGVSVPDDWVNYVTGFLAKGITDVLGFGDDVIGTRSFILKYEDMLHEPEKKKFPGDDNNEYNLEVKIQQNDAEYRLYFHYFTEEVSRKI